MIGARLRPFDLFRTLVASARMRGVLHTPEPRFRNAAAIRAGGAVGLVAVTLDHRVVWLPGVLSHPTSATPRIDLTELTVRDALAAVFRLRYE